MFYVIPLFFIISIIYSSVGFGGGSSYLAILALFTIPYSLMPKVSLLCNIVVVTGACIIFCKAGHLKLSRVWPFVIGSIPMSYLGGKILIQKEIFLFLLALTLIIAASNILFFSQQKYRKNKTVYSKNVNRNVTNSCYQIGISIFSGSILGILSGLVGIGGGVFLAPMLFLTRWGNAKQIAATSSFFILINSLSGLIGQFSKENFKIGDNIHFILPLVLIVFLGGQIGSRLSVFKLSDIMLKKTTAIVVMSVGIRILVKLSFTL